jgi:hypothetical protein
VKELEREGEIDRLSFEEAQELAPFEIVMPTYVPDGLTFAWAEVSQPTHYSRYHGTWRSSSAALVFETGEQDLPEVGILFTPSAFHANVPIWLTEEVRGIGGTGVVRSSRMDGENQRLDWRQGDLYVSLVLTVDSENASDGSPTFSPQYSYVDIERMIESIIQQGPLRADFDEIEDVDPDVDAWAATAVSAIDKSGSSRQPSPA